MRVIKSFNEVNKPVWQIIRVKDGKVMERFKNKLLAMKKVKDLNRMGFEKYELKRDFHWRYNLKLNK